MSQNFTYGVKSIAVSVFCVFLSIFFTYSGANSQSNEPTLLRLQTFINKLQTIDAGFTQHVAEANGNMPQESRGHFSARRPGKFRWDYREPFEQMILSDGKSVYYYEIDLAQVTKTSAAMLEETPAAFFVSDTPLETTFEMSVITDSIWKLPGVKMVPKKEGTVQEITITLHPQKDEILNLTVLDSLGNSSRFTFNEIGYNKPLAADRFQFTIPDDVDVIDESGRRQKNINSL